MISKNNGRSTQQLSTFFRTLGQPTRIGILLTIGEGEACVCHLEATLGLRQAYISQHLMALRNAGIIISRRDGRFIRYRLVDKTLLGWFREAAGFIGLDQSQIAAANVGGTLENCACPTCVPEEYSERQLNPNQ